MHGIQRIGKAVAAAAMALLALLVPASAAQVAQGSNAAFIQVVGRTSIPVGHAEFCKARPAECAAHASVVDAVELTEALWSELLATNAFFNETIVPVTDGELYQVAEFWTYPNGYGDCEDFALAKRRQLIQNGWPVSALLMAVVRQSNGEGHAVLMVRTDRGDLVLDNKDGLIRVWSDTPYQFIKRQSQAHAGQWVDIIDDRAIIVAARQ